MSFALGSSRARIWLLALIAVGCTFALWGTASAFAEGVDPDSLPHGRAYAVAKYSDEFGVSAAVADDHLAKQARGRGLEDELHARLGAGFSGLEFDNIAGRYVVGLTGAADLDTARAIVGGRDLADTIFVSRTWSNDELEAAYGTLTATLAGDAAAGTVQFGVGGSELVLRIADDLTPLARAAIISAASATGVTPTVTIVPRADLAWYGEGTCSFPYCDPPLIAGLGYRSQSDHGACTTGFSVTKVNLPGQFTLTAGHCVINSYNETWYTSSPGWHSIGPDYYGYTDSNGDAGLMRVSDMPNYPAWANWPDYPNLGVFGTGNSQQGQYLCHSGQSSGTSCGTVTFTQVTAIQTVSGKTTVINNETMVSGSGLCSQEGDSGGPWVNPYTGIAYGVHNGATVHQCNTSAFFDPIARVATRLGVTINHL